MKIVSIAIFFVLLLGFSFGVKAQADCLFKMDLSVLDSKGNIPPDVQVKMSGFNFYFGSEKNNFTARRLLLPSEKYKALLNVSAKGFNDFETEIEIYSK